MITDYLILAFVLYTETRRMMQQAAGQVVRVREQISQRRAA